MSITTALCLSGSRLPAVFRSSSMQMESQSPWENSSTILPGSRKNVIHLEDKHYLLDTVHQLYRDSLNPKQSDFTHSEWMTHFQGSDTLDVA